MEPLPPARPLFSGTGAQPQSHWSELVFQVEENHRRHVWGKTGAGVRIRRGQKGNRFSAPQVTRTQTTFWFCAGWERLLRRAESCRRGRLRHRGGSHLCPSSLVGGGSRVTDAKRNKSSHCCVFLAWTASGWLK